MIDVLLIDQEYLFQQAFGKMLEDMDNCRLVGVAENESEAMQLVNRYHPQVIFSDVMIGEENGIELCQRIKELVPSALTYILSSYCNFKLIQNSMMAGIKEYLLKPLSRGKLTALLTERQVQEKEENENASQIYEAIEKRDYKKAYVTAELFIKDCFDKTEDAHKKENLEAIASRLIYMIPGMDKKQKAYYLRKYELTSKTVSHPVFCYCWLVDIITEVFRQLCVLKYTHMSRVMQYIEKHINDEISLSDLSEQARISSGYLSRIFKKYYHISVVDYIHLRKIQTAKYYMVSTEMNISDISFLLGYSEAGYFCKIFKKYEGMTPSSFYSCHIKKLETD